MKFFLRKISLIIFGILYLVFLFNKVMANGFLNPQKILNEIGIQPGMVVADFGSGAGYFAILAAKMVGEKGKVYALDVQKSALESIRSKAKMEGIFNIETVWCNLEIPGGSKLSDDFADLVLLVNILFQSQKQIDIIKEAKRVLKSKGRLVVADWLPDVPMGPKGGNIPSKENVRKLAGGEGLVFEREFDAGIYHYGLVFTKG